VCWCCLPKVIKISPCLSKLQLANLARFLRHSVVRHYRLNLCSTFKKNSTTNIIFKQSLNLMWCTKCRIILLDVQQKQNEIVLAIQYPKVHFTRYIKSCDHITFTFWPQNLVTVTHIVRYISANFVPVTSRCLLFTAISAFTSLLVHVFNWVSPEYIS